MNHRLPSVMAHSQHRPTARWALRLAISVGVLGFSAAAGADMAPGPPPAECVGKPDGSPCVIHNGTAGLCKTGQWGRQPGRTHVYCEPDKNECDRLKVGDTCHGYLGRPAHCKEFTNTEKKTWRTCQVDGVDAPATDIPAAAAAPAPAVAPAVPATPAVPAPAADPAAAPAAKKGLLSCSAVPGAPAAGSTGAALWAAALWLSARRRRS